MQYRHKVLVPFPCIWSKSIHQPTINTTHPNPQSLPCAVIMQRLIWASFCFSPMQRHLPAGTQVLFARSRVQDGGTPTQTDRPVTAEPAECVRRQHSYDSRWLLRYSVCLHDRLWTDRRHGTADGWVMSGSYTIDHSRHEKSWKGLSIRQTFEMSPRQGKH